MGLNARTATLVLSNHGVKFPSPVARLQRTAYGVVAISPKMLEIRSSKSRDHRAVAGSKGLCACIFESIRKMQPELVDLPWRMGDDCHLVREPAEKLQTLSRELRNVLVAATTGLNTGPNPETLRGLLSGARPEILARIRARAGRVIRGGVVVPPPEVPGECWLEPDAIPALMQLLTAERTSTRQVLVDALGKIPGPAAVKALTRLAVFDIAPEVRDQAIQVLRDQPAESYTPDLLQGLRYPGPLWPTMRPRPWSPSRIVRRSRR